MAFQPLGRSKKLWTYCCLLLHLFSFCLALALFLGSSKLSLALQADSLLLRSLSCSDSLAFFLRLEPLSRRLPRSKSSMKATRISWPDRGVDSPDIADWTAFPHDLRFIRHGHNCTVVTIAKNDNNDFDLLSHPGGHCRGKTREWECKSRGVRIPGSVHHISILDTWNGETLFFFRISFSGVALCCGLRALNDG